jgi:hypothetical protein
MTMTRNHPECRRANWHGRKAYVLANDRVTVTALCGGGHIADLRLVDGPDVSPMWVPPWPTIEPYNYVENSHKLLYGTTTEGKLLSGLAGHSVCLDYFGSPSPEEAKQGLSQHGEAPSSKWHLKTVSRAQNRINAVLSVSLPIAGLDFTRSIQLSNGESVVYFTETVRNRRKADHFFHWTQHVTLGAQFLSGDQSYITLPGRRALTYPHGYDEGKALLASDQEFTWPNAPLVGGGTTDLTRPFVRKGLGFVVGVQLERERSVSFVAAVNAEHNLAIAYCFKTEDFPWVAVWEENLGIAAVPWKESTQARGLEFSTTPLPVFRRESFLAGHIFGQPTRTFVPAMGAKSVRYVAVLRRLPEGFGRLQEIELREDTVVFRGDSTSIPAEMGAKGIKAFFEQQ